MKTGTTVAVILATSIAATTAGTLTAARASAVQEERVSSVGAILLLDAVIQKRFENVDRRFGLTRIMLPGGAHGFAPENDAEISSLRELEEATLRVALYLGGRRLLGPRPDGTRDFLWDRIKGPAMITRGPHVAAPAIETMWHEGRRAFAAFQRNEPQHEFAVGSWDVLARPVRAANGTCLKCHRSTGDNDPAGASSDLRVGDVLGVVFYAYQESATVRAS